MTIVVKPEVGVPVQKDASYDDLKEYVSAAAETVEELAEHGLEVDANKEDQDVAAKITSSYASDPDKTSKKITLKKAATLTPASLVITNNI